MATWIKWWKDKTFLTIASIILIEVIICLPSILLLPNIIGILIIINTCLVGGHFMYKTLDKTMQNWDN